ncbi:MAG: hypothetical protein HQL64_09735 [Magnetococcales bacterium]|nr:hypothetical protein [Magnetococcales bacterium]
MTEYMISTLGKFGLPFQINPDLPVIEYFLEGEPIGVAIPRPGMGAPRSHSPDENDCLPCLEKRWCAPSDLVLQ